MSGIFLSYKRLDGDYATLLYAWLTERFGSEQVFWDHEDIEPGASFGDVLRERIRTAGALVALIGPGWSLRSGFVARLAVRFGARRSCCLSWLAT